jgi:hypothetical protein
MELILNLLGCNRHTVKKCMRFQILKFQVQYTKVEVYLWNNQLPEILPGTEDSIPSEAPLGCLDFLMNSTGLQTDRNTKNLVIVTRFLRKHQSEDYLN